MNTIRHSATNNGSISRWALGSIAFLLMGSWSCSTNLRDYDALDTNEGGAAGANSTGGSTDTGGDTGAGAAPASGGTGGSTPNIDAGGEGGRITNMPDTDPESCTDDSECLSGNCRISYRDRDGDGYGNTSEMTGRCDGSIPAGYAQFGGDCCDDGGNLELAALIHPGQTEYFDSPAGICGIIWDYNCSGAVETSPAERDAGCSANATPPSCTADRVPMTETDCGQQRGINLCYVVTSNPSGPQCSGSVAGPVTVRCR